MFKVRETDWPSQHVLVEMTRHVTLDELPIEQCSAHDTSKEPKIKQVIIRTRDICERDVVSKIEKEKSVAIQPRNLLLAGLTVMHIWF